VACWDYNWDESSDDYDDYDAATDDGYEQLSPRSARARQQQLDAMGKKGPKVLKPEGAALLRPASRGPTGPSSAAAASGNRDRSPSPSRPIPEPYQLPTETDDLATVVKAFLQHEVLRYGRRSKLAGSSLSVRRAKDKPQAFQGWEPLSSTCAW
jgi:hypothetical protein